MLLLDETETNTTIAMSTCLVFYPAYRRRDGVDFCPSADFSTVKNLALSAAEVVMDTYLDIHYIWHKA